MRGRALRGVRTLSTAAAASVAPGASPPTSVLLEALARSTPGTSSFGSPAYAPGTSAPYPIWALDPAGSAYAAVLRFAGGSADLLTALHAAAAPAPWWVTIVATGALLRAALLPTNLYSLRNASNAVDAAPDLALLRRAFARARAAQPEPAARIAHLLALQRGVVAALHKVRCYPLRSLGMPLLQVPIVLGGVLGARHAVLLGDASFETGGTLWFTDLTVPDPTFALPCVALGLAYASLDLIFSSSSSSTTRAAAAVATTTSTMKTESAASTTDAAAQAATLAIPPPLPLRAPATGGAMVLGSLGSVVKSVFQVGLIFSVPFACDMPAGLYLLMAANSLWTMGYVSAIRHPTVYKAVTGREPGGPKGGVVVGGASPVSSSTGVVTGGASTPPSPALPSPPTIPSSATAASPAAAAPVAAAAHVTPPGTARAVRIALNPLVLQLSPRLLYNEGDSVNLEEEARNMDALSRSLGTSFPLVGGPNPLLLRFAGGTHSSLWNRPFPKHHQYHHHSAQGTVAAAAATTVTAVAQAATAAAAATATPQHRTQEVRVHAQPPPQREQLQQQEGPQGQSMSALQSSGGGEERASGGAQLMRSGGGADSGMLATSASDGDAASAAAGHHTLLLSSVAGEVTAAPSEAAHVLTREDAGVEEPASASAAAAAAPEAPPTSPAEDAAALAALAIQQDVLRKECFALPVRLSPHAHPGPRRADPPYALFHPASLGLFFAHDFQPVLDNPVAALFRGASRPRRTLASRAATAEMERGHALLLTLAGRDATSSSAAAAAVEEEGDALSLAPAPLSSRRAGERRERRQLLFASVPSLLSAQRHDRIVWGGTGFPTQYVWEQLQLRNRKGGELPPQQRSRRQRGQLPAEAHETLVSLLGPVPLLQPAVVAARLLRDDGAGGSSEGNGGDGALQRPADAVFAANWFRADARASEAVENAQPLDAPAPPLVPVAPLPTDAPSSELARDAVLYDKLISAPQWPLEPRGGGGGGSGINWSMLSFPGSTDAGYLTQAVVHTRFTALAAEWGGSSGEEEETEGGSARREETRAAALGARIAAAHAARRQLP